MIVKSEKTLVLADPGVKISSKWDGEHQGGAHIRDGVYWEACYIPDKEERRIQLALLDTRPPSTRERAIDILRRDQNGRQKKNAEEVDVLQAYFAPPTLSCK